MARTRSNPSQPNDASQEPQRGENPTEHREARDTREVREAQMNGVEEVLRERARVPSDLIQGSGLVNDVNREETLVNGSGSARASDEASAPPCNDRGPYHRTTAAKRMQRHFLAAELLYI
jgi:hypothetical protein